jgi:DNA-binding NtrC family response regulator
MSTALARLLVVDDDASVVDYLTEMLEDEGYKAVACTSPLLALQWLRDGQQFDLIVSDIEMPELRGVDFLAEVLKVRPGQLVLLITAFGSIDLAVQAVRAGACDFLAKPFQIEQLVFAVARALRERSLRHEVVRLRSTLQATTTGGLLARSAAMRKVVDLARRAARTDATVLVCGESGVGKAHVARFLHEDGPRAAGRFVHVHCAALAPAIVEAELFGVARPGEPVREGLLQQSDGGTLFLDEVTELPLEVQPKLLEALESGKIRPLGADRDQAIQLRVVASTQRPLEDLVREKRFRADLYYRLNVIRLEIPPLRDRPEDLQVLVDLCLQRASERLHRPVLGISQEALRWMLRYPWPGNVRELANLLERAVALSEHDTVLLEDLHQVQDGDDDDEVVERAAALGLSLAELERAYIQKMLATHLGNKTTAAKALGIDRRTLYRKIEEFGFRKHDDDDDHAAEPALS